jgi:broad-specificity NMP kinase
MIKHEIICLLGNNGCGKSSICQLINLNNDTIIAIERSNELGAKFGIDPNIIDKLTLEYVFDEENFNKITLPNQTMNEEKIYWIILDCEVDTILKRIQTRTTKNIWETQKALNYFQQRFRHLSGHFGIPFIDTTHQTLEQVYNYIIDIVKKYSNYYQYYRQIGTQILNYDLIQQYDIENKLYKIINTYDFDQITNLPEYAHEFHNIDKRKLYIRWYINKNSFEIDQQKHILKIGDYELPITGTIFQLIIEGESKKVYKDISENPFTKNLVIIVLKSTIYSHSMQITGEINNLGKRYIHRLIISD